MVIMKILQGQKDLSAVKNHILGNLCVEFSYLTEKGASFNVLKLKVQVLLILERIKNLHYERTFLIDVSQEGQNFSFRYNMVNLLIVGYALFFDYFKSTESIVNFVESFMNFAKITYTDQFLKSEI